MMHFFSPKIFHLDKKAPNKLGYQEVISSRREVQEVEDKTKKKKKSMIVKHALNILMCPRISCLVVSNSL